MKNTQIFSAVAAALLVSGVHAAPIYDASVTPGVIFGSGNANGSFTVDRANNVELGLRGKLRHNALGQAENTFNSNGDGTYSFAKGVAPTQSGQTAVWSVEFSINTDLSGTSGRKLDDLTYRFGFDTDASQGESFLIADLINVAFADHALGDNSTVQCANSTDNGNDADGCHGKGQASRNAGEYATRVSSLNVAQNSQKAHWLLGAGFDPTVDGTYSFYLAAYSGLTELARTDIQIIVGDGGAQAVPEPGSIALVGLALAGLATMRRRTS